MNYNLRTLCANFSRGKSTSWIVPDAVWGLFHCLPLPIHKGTPEWNHNISHCAVAAYIFTLWWVGDWEPSGPCWQVWFIPVIFSLKHYSNKEDTYYHSQPVFTQSDPPTLACPTGRDSMNVALKLHTHTDWHSSRTLVYMHALTYTRQTQAHMYT